MVNHMRKIFCIAIVFLLISGCSQTKNKLVFDGEPLNNSFFKIYQIDNNSTIYSVFPENKFQMENAILELKDALENKKITINDILNQMEYETSLNDGGTLIYKNKSKKISSTDFYLISCHAYKKNMKEYIEDYYIVTDYLKSDICKE